MAPEYHDLCRGGSQRIQRSLDPIRRMHSVGRTTTTTCCSRRSRHPRDTSLSVLSGRSYACDHRKRPLRRWRIANYAVYSRTIRHSIARILPLEIPFYATRHRDAEAPVDGGDLRKFRGLMKRKLRRHFKVRRSRCPEIARGKGRRKKKSMKMSGRPWRMEGVWG